MKRLSSQIFCADDARKEWCESDALLRSKATLGERSDILPFFRDRKNLSLLLSNYAPDLRVADRIAHEFVIQGDFVIDMVIGDATLGKFLLVEFEDGTPNSVFAKTPKAAPDWARRFEGAFSQIVDWFWKLEDMRNTISFSHVFGTREASFHGLIICGKGLNLTAQESARLKWRIEKIRVDSKALSFVSFDDLRNDTDFWLTRYYGV